MKMEGHRAPPFPGTGRRACPPGGEFARRLPRLHGLPRQKRARFCGRQGGHQSGPRLPFAGTAGHAGCSRACLQRSHLLYSSRSPARGRTPGQACPAFGAGRNTFPFPAGSAKECLTAPSAFRCGAGRNPETLRPQAKTQGRHKSFRVLPGRQGWQGGRRAPQPRGTSRAS